MFRWFVVMACGVCWVAIDVTSAVSQQSRGGNGGNGGNAITNIYVSPGGQITVAPGGGAGGNGGNVTGPSQYANSGPSFNCSSATRADERTICADPTLANLDNRLANAYWAAMNRTYDAVSSTMLRQSQRNWLQQRSACSANRGCIEQVYEARIPQLQNWR
jgi:uncharacterized protein YecT (DUF1311 family)